MMNSRKRVFSFLGSIFLSCLLFSGCTKDSISVGQIGVEQQTVESVVVQEATEKPAATIKPQESQQQTTSEEDIPQYAEGENPPPPELTWIANLSIPEYAGTPYAVINDNEPFFDKAVQKPVAYEVYYALDDLGRCTLADAIVGPETQPTEKRGNISEVHPTGWHKDKYDFVNGQSLYNRCHLIAYYLGAENANPNNLVTGTRYMNEDGMNDFENMVGDYIKETGNHVRYRVTPIWTGNNLVCDGVLMEAYSIEDAGDYICFCVYCYNVQPGVIIDYATGDNYAADSNGKQPFETKEPAATKKPSEQKPSGEVNEESGDYVLNVKSMKFHLPTCSGAIDMSEKNKKEFSGKRADLVDQGYMPCGLCNP